MDVSFLSEFSNVRELLLAASARASWWQIFRAPKFARVVRDVKNDKFEEFREMLESYVFLGDTILDLLREGHVIALKHLVNHELDFTTPGRVVASLAFLATVIDVWSEDCIFLPDFVLDSVALSLWQMVRFRLKVQEIGQEEEDEGDDQTEK